MNQHEFWDNAAQDPNVRDEWICDKNVTDKQCLDEILPHLIKGNSLDLGCGIGRLTQDTGVDVSYEMLEIANKANKKKYFLCNGWTLPFEDERFNNVYSLAMFQHITDINKQAYLNEVYRVLKHGGIFRVQFVTDGEQAPFNYPVKASAMINWMKQIGFTITKTDVGHIFKEWTWLTAKK